MSLEEKQMAILYDILEKKELDKYPPLPGWIKELIEMLDKQTDYYFDFTTSIRFDPFTNSWTRTTND